MLAALPGFQHSFLHQSRAAYWPLGPETTRKDTRNKRKKFMISAYQDAPEGPRSHFFDQTGIPESVLNWGEGSNRGPAFGFQSALDGCLWI